MLGITHLSGFGGAAVVGAYDPDAQIYFDRATDVESTCKDDINTLVLALKSSGAWSKLDCLHVAGESPSGVGAGRNNMMLNIKGASYDATAVGNPTFTDNQGVSILTGKYIDSNFEPMAGITNLDSEDMVLYIYARVLPDSATYYCGVDDGSKSLFIKRDSATQTQASVESRVANLTSSEVGGWAAEGFTPICQLLDDTSGSVGVGSATGIPSGHNIYVGALNSSGTAVGVGNNMQISAWAFGSAMAVASQLHPSIQAYFTSRGTAV